MIIFESADPYFSNFNQLFDIKVPTLPSYYGNTIHVVGLWVISWGKFFTDGSKKPQECEPLFILLPPIPLS
jgi:hypothetical protein